MNYWRNLSSVLLGTIIAQTLPVLGSLIIARQFVPADFGVYSIWLGITVFISVCLTGRFEIVLPMKRDRKKRSAAVLYILSTTIIATIFLFLILALIFFIGVKSIGLISVNFLCVSLIVAALMAFSQIWQNWAIAEGFIKKLSLIRIVQAGSVVILQVGFGIIQPDVMGLIIGHFIGLLFSFLICLLLMPVKVNFDNIKFGLLAFWKRNIRFPLITLPADIVNSAAMQLPLILIANKFGATNAGYYALTIRALGAPIGLLGSAALDIFKRQAARAYIKRGECELEFLHTFKILLAGSALSSILFFFFAEQLILFAYGENWSMSGKIAIWMIPLFALKFVASPLSFMNYIAGKQHADSFWQISLLITTIATLNSANAFSDSVKIYSLGYAFLYLIYLKISYTFSLGSK